MYFTEYDITRTILSQAKIPHISHRGKRSTLEDDTVPLTTTVAEIEVRYNWVRVKVFNTTFNNISVLSWQ